MSFIHLPVKGHHMPKVIEGFKHEQPIIGVMHLLPLPGAPRFDGDFQRVLKHALADAEALVGGGVDAILIENFGDTPYFANQVPRETIASMTRVGGMVRDRFTVPLGVCVLRNDARAALAIAHSIDAQFIRVCILAFPRVTDQGVVHGEADLLLRDRARFGSSIRIFADVDVKHSYPLATGHPLEAEARDLISRSHADALIITGSATGAPIGERELAKLREAVDAPILVGSGVSSTNIRTFSQAASGFIIGTSFKDSKHAGAPVSVEKVRAIVDQLRG